MPKPEDKQYYHVVFHFNHYRDKWCRIPRDEFSKYLNGPIYSEGNTIKEAFDNYLKSKVNI